MWPHQVEAIELACKTLTGGGRATQVLACGTGKTRIGAHAAVRLAPGGRRLVLAPTVLLLAQLLGEYRAAVGDAALGRVLVVCQDRHAGEASGLGREQLAALHVPVTTDPAVIAQTVSQTVSGAGPVTVLSTYASVKALISAHHDHGLGGWDVLIADEAHRTVVGSAWSHVHDDARLPAVRRLYMTATPRLVIGDKPADVEVAGMDDEAVYGPTIYRLGYATAIEVGLLARYRLVVSVVSNDDIRALTDHTVARNQVRVGRALIPADMLAAQIAVLRAAAQYGLTRAISYHAGIDTARHFAATLPAVADLLPAGARPGTVWAEHLRHTHPEQLRHRWLGQLAAGVDGGLALLANARLLSEGVDVPAVDAVVFADPRHSTVDIIQAIGRAVRRGDRPDKTATIIVPLLADPAADPAIVLAGSAYAPIWRVLQALRAHDDDLAAELDARRRTGGQAAGGQAAARMPRWLNVDGSHIPAAFAEAIMVRMVQGATASWQEFYTAARAYRAEHGDLLIPQQWATDTGLGLGQWLHSQRILYRRGVLRPERITRLEAIGMVWHVQDAAWERGYAAAARYAAQHGHPNAPAKYTDPDGFKLGWWIRNQRAAHDNATIDPGRARRLEDIGIIWRKADADKQAFWQRAYAAARAYHAAHGHLNVPRCYVTGDGFQLGRWIDRLRTGTTQLPQHHRAALNNLGMRWTGRNRQSWERGLAAARAYHSAHGHLQVPQKWVTDDGFPLGRWLTDRRRRPDTCTAEQRAQLDALDPTWAHPRRTNNNNRKPRPPPQTQHA